MSEKKYGRYAVSAVEDYEPNSNNKVLKNYLKITSKQEMDEIEARELKRTALELQDIYDMDHQFTVNDLCNIHKLWLGNIYPWAGKFRTVNMEKDGFPFAAANRIEDLMKSFEKNHLSKYTPCNTTQGKDIAQGLAHVHVEFIIIHPFREGNGRIARLLSDLMVLQANKPLLDFSCISDDIGFKRYIKAIHSGHIQNITPLKEIFLEALNTNR